MHLFKNALIFVTTIRHQWVKFVERKLFFLQVYSEAATGVFCEKSCSMPATLLKKDSNTGVFQ